MFVYTAFSFEAIGAKEKAWQKEKRRKKGISPSADGDQRPTALDPCRLPQKAGENFHQTDESR
ncbi:MAG: hypothetical protein IJW30_02555 [Clostridia bacterium]|nr:hypothetical protein [Clostridia bacterium]